MLNVVIFGAPGSGKGTQSELIIKEYGLDHISTGDVLRSEMKNDTELGKIAKDYIEKGQLVPDELIVNMLAKVLDSKENSKGVIFDGFPRTTAQAVALDDMLARMNRPLDAALLVDVPGEVIIGRALNRRVCKYCGYVGTAADAACPKCSGEMYQRADDTEDTVRNRLDVYEKSTSPLIDYYRGKGVLKTVDGNRPVDVVFADMKALLGL